MDGPAEQFAGRPAAAARGGVAPPPAGGAGRAAGAAGAPSATGAATAAVLTAGPAGPPQQLGPRGGGTGARAGAVPEGASYNGQPCASGRGGAGGPGGGGAGRGRGAEITPEQIAAQ